MKNMMKYVIASGVALVASSAAAAEMYLDVGVGTAYSKYDVTTTSKIGAVDSGNTPVAIQKTSHKRFAPTASVMFGARLMDGFRADLEISGFGFSAKKSGSQNVTVGNIANATGVFTPTTTQPTPVLAADTKLQQDFKIKSYATMLNAYYDLDVSETIKPYVMAGIGLQNTSYNVKVAYLNANNTIVADSTAYQIKKSKLSLAYQVGAGANFKISDSVYAGVGYKFRGSNAKKMNMLANITNDAANKSKHGAEINSKGVHSITANVRFEF
jgi:opacity protein-like surface antigen